MHWQILPLHKRKKLIVLKQMRCPFCIVSQYNWTSRAAYSGRRLLLAGTIQGQKRTLLPPRGSIGLISRVQNSQKSLSLSLFCPVFFEIWSMTRNRNALEVLTRIPEKRHAPRGEYSHWGFITYEATLEQKGWCKVSFRLPRVHRAKTDAE